jgi:hypothetical protein
MRISAYKQRKIGMCPSFSKIYLSLQMLRTESAENASPGLLTIAAHLVGFCYSLRHEEMRGTATSSGPGTWNMSLKGGMAMMNLSLTESETKIVRHALETYISKLREEIVKTDNHEWKKSLHVEEDTLKSIVEKLMATSAA